MNQRQIGSVLILFAIVIASLVYFFKMQEDTHIQELMDAQAGSCFTNEGKCIYENRNLWPYISGWAISVALLLFGLYLAFVDKTQQVLAQHQQTIVKSLEEAKKKDEFSAFLAGFSKDEQSILKAIHTQEGILQSTLRYRTGLSKTSLSLILKGLEEKQLISKKEAGKTNQLYLRKKF